MSHLSKLATVALCLSVPSLGATPAAPRELTWAPGPDGALRDRLYPLGFSKKGAFAAIIEPPDEACGCYFANFVIFDSVNDVFLENVSYSSDDPATFPVELHGPAPTNLESFWRDGAAVWEQKLKAHGIVSAPLALDSTTRGSVKLRLAITMAPPSEDARGTIAAYDVTATGTKGQKLLTHRTFDKSLPMGAAVVGMLKSPFEPRAVVLVSETWMGWEGPPNPVHLRFVGCHLERGFAPELKH